MITEDYVSFEIAKLLKEKGFDEATYHDYDTNGLLWFNEVLAQYNQQGTGFACPTLQMVMKWLREVYDKSIEIKSEGFKLIELGWIAEIYNLKNQDEEYYSPFPQSSYEEACEEAIKYCLENLI